MTTIAIVLTEHAIRRFMERIVPGLDLFDATDLLAELLGRASLYERADDGALHWKLPIYGAIVVSRPDVHLDPSIHIARTVLAAGPRIDPDLLVAIRSPRAPGRDVSSVAPPGRHRDRVTREERAGASAARRRKAARFEQHRWARLRAQGRVA